MCCGSGGPTYTTSNPLALTVKPKGSSKGVLKAPKNLAKKEGLEKSDPSLESTDPPTPVVGEAGPTNNSSEKNDEK